MNLKLEILGWLCPAWPPPSPDQSVGRHVPAFSLAPFSTEDRQRSILDFGPIPVNRCWTSLCTWRRSQNPRSENSKSENNFDSRPWKIWNLELAVAYSPPPQRNCQTIPVTQKLPAKPPKP